MWRNTIGNKPLQSTSNYGLQSRFWLCPELFNVTVAAPGGVPRELIHRHDRLQLQSFILEKLPLICSSYTHSPRVMFKSVIVSHRVGQLLISCQRPQEFAKLALTPRKCLETNSCWIFISSYTHPPNFRVRHVACKIPMVITNYSAELGPLFEFIW